MQCSIGRLKSEARVKRYLYQTYIPRRNTSTTSPQPDSNNRRHRLWARQAVRECAKVYLERLYSHPYQGTHTSCDDAGGSHLVFVTLAILSNIADAVTMIACTL